MGFARWKWCSSCFVILRSESQSNVHTSSFILLAHPTGWPGISQTCTYCYLFLDPPSAPLALGPVSCLFLGQRMPGSPDRLLFYQGWKQWHKFQLILVVFRLGLWSLASLCYRENSSTMMPWQVFMSPHGPCRQVLPDALTFGNTPCDNPKIWEHGELVRNCLQGHFPPTS